MSSGSNAARSLAQQALKLRIISQSGHGQHSNGLRATASHKIATTASNASIGNIGKDALWLIKYLPTNIFNKIQSSIKSSPAVPSPTASTADDLAPTKVQDILPLQDELHGAAKEAKVHAIPKTSPTAQVTQEATPAEPQIDPEPFPLGFADTDMNWQHLEARTRYLVSVLNRNVGICTPHHLIHHIEGLFLHIYQHHDTRTTAIESGALKVLFKILNLHKDDLYIVNRTRELLAMLGYNPPCRGRGIRILSIDGGGVRGLVVVEILRRMEKLTGKRIHEMFDYICGVSTGSILAFLVGVQCKTLDEAEILYKELSREIFTQNTWTGAASLFWYHSYYHTGTLENVLKKHVGEAPLISHAKCPDLPRVSAVSTVVSNEKVTPYVFRTYTIPVGVNSTYPGGCRYEMWQAVRASAAAPTYFEELKLGRYIHQDGGVTVNNPCSVALSEAKSIWQGVPLQCVVSLGTGLSISCRADPHLSDLHTLPDPKDAQSLTWKDKFYKILDSATDTESVHYTLKDLLPSTTYFRFNPFLTDAVGMDETKPEKFVKIQEETREYLDRNIERLDAACKALTKEKNVLHKVIDLWH